MTPRPWGLGKIGIFLKAKQKWPKSDLENFNFLVTKTNTFFFAKQNSSSDKRSKIPFVFVNKPRPENIFICYGWLDSVKIIFYKKNQICVELPKSCWKQIYWLTLAILDRKIGKRNPIYFPQGPHHSSLLQPFSKTIYPKNVLFPRKPCVFFSRWKNCKMKVLLINIDNHCPCGSHLGGERVQLFDLARIFL